MDKPAYTLHFDGGCMPKNPGGIAIGSYVVYDKNGKIVTEGAEEECRGPTATNNVAEWAGVRNGIKAVHALTGGDCLLHIKGDSQLVINQINGKFQVKKDTLKPFHQECMGLLADFDVWKATWVRRELNEYADEIGNKRYDEVK